MVQGPRPDAGFSMLELLVALVLASLIVIGVGGLLTLCIQVRDRIDETTRVERALLDLRAVVGNLKQPARVRLNFDPAAGGFDLVPAATVPSSVAEDEAAIALRLDGKVLAVVDRVAGRASSVDLSPFENITIEYLTVTDQSYGWQTSGDGQTVAGVRLELTLRHRSWRVLLWLVEPALLQPV